jgi:uncharacterized protein YbjT (DUF2867 family)
MKIVVIGGSGLIGSQVVRSLNERSHEALAASPSSGVNSLTGDGLDQALRGADVLVDVTNSPSFEDTAVLDFFTTSTRNLLEAEAAAGVRHHVALSVVGADRTDQSGYLRAKVAQEQLISGSPIPHTIVRATQFFEFAGAIADEATHGKTVRLSPAFIQPIAASDVASAVVTAALGDPVTGLVEIGGPEKFRFEEFVREYLRSTGDQRDVVSDPAARYFNALLDDDTIVPGGSATIYRTRFADWLRRQRSTAAPASAI